MKLILFDNYAELSELGAKYVAKRINEFTSRNPNKFFVLGLPTGSIININ
jgi:6-phosphogluconolactonase/glucosamine-6-phosphate isomerase/deaminase